jgi:hypothetical protein
MAEGFAADAITRLGWRQGSVLGRLLVDEAIRLKPDKVTLNRIEHRRHAIDEDLVMTKRSGSNEFPRHAGLASRLG